MSPQTASGRAHYDDLMTNDHPYRESDAEWLNETLTAIEREAQALVLDALEAAVRERIDAIGVERGRAHTESKHDYEAGVEFAHNLFVGLFALIQQHREAIR
jgi:hypothetical protein